MFYNWKKTFKIYKKVYMHESKVHMFPLKEAPNGNLYYKNTEK